MPGNFYNSKIFRIDNNRSIELTHNKTKAKALKFLLMKNEENLNKRRQLKFPSDLEVSFDSYDYNDYYGEYILDIAYDYYDWVCSGKMCVLCNLLEEICCDPEFDRNCFLSESCSDNPCLAGGTCINTRTIDNRHDFFCDCKPGLIGKYCQIPSDYFTDSEILDFLTHPPSPSTTTRSLSTSTPAPKFHKHSKFNSKNSRKRPLRINRKGK